MIDRFEIEQKAKEFDINTSNVQRDYIFGWFLAGIFTVSELKNYLILKGGNCFRKAYYKNTRYSNDLDFAVETGLKNDFIKKELDKVCDYVNEATGITFIKERSLVQNKKRIEKDKQVYEARVYFKDFYGKESEIIISIRLDISQFEKLYLQPQQRNIIHPYSDSKECTAVINCVKLEEALASKLKCLLQRRHSCDLYDYAHWIFFENELDIKKSEILSTLLKITIFEKSPGVLHNLLFNLPFDLLKERWLKYLICPKNTRLSFDSCIEKFKSHISEFLGSLPIGTEQIVPLNPWVFSSFPLILSAVRTFPFMSLSLHLPITGLVLLFSAKGNSVTSFLVKHHQSLFA